MDALKNKRILIIIGCALVVVICAVSWLVNGRKNRGNILTTQTDTLALKPTPEFHADSAYRFTEEQCAFGPRIMNSEAHDRCGDYIVARFKQYGATVVEQKMDLAGYDGTVLKCRNIIASVNPECSERILVCGHWDSRPWADNDPKEENWHTPVLAANDAASDVAVMLEMARVMQQQKPSVGVDFICFDAEDYGLPSWAEDVEDSEDTWCLGSQYWSRLPHVDAYRPRYGILLDMVGGAGATFYKEQFSDYYAGDVLNKVWNTAAALGYDQIFINRDGAAVTDDHIPINKIAGIPCIDIIAYYPHCESSSFGPTWHTTFDTMEYIDRNVLKAVGQTVLQVIYNEVP
jgi:hypothetical protein